MSPAARRSARARLRRAPDGVRALFTDAARAVHNAVADRREAERMPQRPERAPTGDGVQRRGTRHPCRSMRSRSRDARSRLPRPAALALTAALMIAAPALSGCTDAADGTSGNQGPVATASPHAPGTDAAATAPGPASAAASASPPAPESFRGGATPTPEATITPAPGSWDTAPVPASMHLTVISADRDPDTLALLDAVTVWAAEHRAHVSALAATDPDALAAVLTGALPMSPDLVVGVGRGVVDVFALETAQFLDQQFLVLGAQLAEPTENVTAVIWPGAAFRGTGISDADVRAADSAVTAERARHAVQAGVASVIWGLTGIVIQLE